MVETFIPKYYGLCLDIGTQRVYYEIFVEEKLTRQSAGILKGLPHQMDSTFVDMYG